MTQTKLNVNMFTTDLQYSRGLAFGLPYGRQASAGGLVSATMYPTALFTGIPHRSPISTGGCAAISLLPNQSQCWCGCQT
jgi:hypothetical protein